MIAELIKMLKERGKKVISVKKVHHTYHLQADTKDSSQFLNAGADEVYLVAEGEIINMRRVETSEMILPLLKNHPLNPDFVLMEGFYHETVPLIEVWDSSVEGETKFALEKLTAIVSDQQVEGNIPCFPKNEVLALVKFMEEYNG